MAIMMVVLAMANGGALLDAPNGGTTVTTMGGWQR